MKRLTRRFIAERLSFDEEEKRNTDEGSIISKNPVMRFFSNQGARLSNRSNVKKQEATMKSFSNTEFKPSPEPFYQSVSYDNIPKI